MTLTKKQLEKIVGRGNVADDDATLSAYAGDQSFVQTRRPDMVVFAESTDQVQQIVKLANTVKAPLVPYSSGLNLHGAAVPDQGGIILNMTRMNNILRLDEDNWYVMIEPGVTYRQLQDYLGEKGYRIMMPLGIPPERSVLTSTLERDPVLAAPSFEHGNYLIMDTELVLPNGEIFRTGNWASGGEPGAPSGPIRNTIFRLWTAAQGTLGIMTKMVLQIEPLQTQQRLFFLPFTTLAEAAAAIKSIQLREIGTECFLLNNFNLAALFTNGWTIPERFPAQAVPNSEFDQLRALLPPWVLTICINGNVRRPEEKIAYESAALTEVCQGLNVQLLESLPNIPGAENVLARELLRPWSVLKKFNYRGSVQDLTFKAPLQKAPGLAALIEGLARKHGYPESAIGMFVLPLERGRGVHCEFDLHCPGADGPERSAVQCLWTEASAALINGGAYFDRPYGAWSALVYARAAEYGQMLKKLKKETDPNNILNPGKLCFT